MHLFLNLVLCLLLGCAPAMSPNAVERPPDGSTDQGGGGDHGGLKDGTLALPSPDPPNRVQVERYPRMVMPGQVAKGLETTVFVGLATTEGSATAQTVVIEGNTQKTGAIVLDLPELAPGETSWAIDVILSAPDFEIGGGDDFRTIQLPADGPSTMARYTLTLRNVPRSGETDVQAFLFHEGAFMGHIGRTVKAYDKLPASGPPSGPDSQETRGSASSVQARGASHELHLIALDGKRALVVVAEPGKLLSHAIVDFDSARLPSFLGPKWGAIRSRGLDALDEGAGDPVGMGMVRGLGSQLWELAPAPIRAHVLAIYDNPEIDALRVYTNVPSFPWELVRPQKADGTKLEMLGNRFRLGRWHLRMGMEGLTVPPERVEYQELVAMMPTYAGTSSLPALQRELVAMQAVHGFRRIPGRAASVAQVVQDPPNGVLHFAGHGAAKRTGDASTTYALSLEDGTFDTLAFLGLEGNHLRDRETVVFFNACELGQSDAAMSIVDGWAPAMLDAGASGYIGALWPIGDDEAASFAESFYREVESSIAAQGQATVTEILRCLRRRGTTRDDPTWQAYVFYGDPDTVLYRPDVVVPEGTPAYTCK